MPRKQFGNKKRSEVIEIVGCQVMASPFYPILAVHLRNQRDAFLLDRWGFLPGHASEFNA
jgi:hypothetical protein